MAAFKDQTGVFPLSAMVWQDDPSTQNGPRVQVTVRPDVSPTSSGSTRDKHASNTTIHFSNTHHNDQVALTLIKGAFNPEVWKSYNSTGLSSPSEIIQKMMNEAYGWLASNLSCVQSHFAKPSVLREWVTADVRPSANGAPSPGHFGIACLAPQTG